MRAALLIATIHGDDALRILASGDPAEVNVAYKALTTEPGPYAEIQLWDSGGGVTKRKRFEPTKEAVATARAGFKKAAAYEAEIETLRERIAALEAAADKAAADKVAADKAAADKAGNKTVVGGK